MRDTTNLCVEIMNSKRQVRGKLGHVVQLRVCRLTFDVNVTLDLSKVFIWRKIGQARRVTVSS